MKISPGFWGSLFTGSRGWELGLDGQALVYAKAGQVPVRIALDYVQGAAATSGAIWAEIKIAAPDLTISCDGVVKGKAERFVSALRSAVGQAVLATISRHGAELNQLAAGLIRLLARPRYLANRDLEVWKSTIASTGQSALARVLALVGNPLLPREGAPADIRERIDLLTDVLSGARAQVKRRNERFVADELVKHKTFFDRVERTALTPEQRTASVVMEDRNLLVAAAGSGKTATLVGKIGYALLTKEYAPGDLLVLAFSKNAAKELDERINEQLRPLLPGGERVKATTFHALGLEIMAIAEGKKPSIANFAGGGEAADSAFIEQIIQQCIGGDKEFAADWVMFRAVCFEAARNPAEFKSLDHWHKWVRAGGEYQNGKRGLPTIQGEIVKSHGELAIANWLYMHGVDYEYERAYEHNTADLQRRQYRPDFYLPAIKTYLEHYALDKHGRAPAAFGPGYAEAIQWKARVHADKGTALITTTFGDFVSGELYSKLETVLRKLGQACRPRPIAEVLTRLNELQKTDYRSFLRTCLKHAKSNEVDEATLRTRSAGSPEPFRAQLFVRVLWKLMVAYEARLRQAGEIDFEDMIIRAAHYVASDGYRHNYKMILVDEFQDISQARAKLLRALLTQAPDAKLFSVGDDWQSIYRFAGGDIDVFRNFDTHFGVTATSYLTQAFRSNQGITDAASRFVRRNPSQMKKRVKAQDATSQGVVVLRRYGAPQEMVEECEASLDEIARGVEAGKRASVFLLGRYRHQKPDALDKWTSRFRSLDITFRTVHSSKGLQADYVIIMGLESGRYAFPSEIHDDPLLQLVMPQAESFRNAEERRLFYVAMTRARHRVYLLGSNYSPSTFLKEIDEDASLRTILRYEQVAPEATADRSGKPSAPLETCPQCGKGKLRRRTGKRGEFIGCSNFPNCNFTRNVADRSSR